MKNYRKIFSGVLAASMLFAAIPSTNAASTTEIQSQIDALEAEHSSISEQLAALQEQENANWESTEEMVAQKSNIDQQIFLLYSELDNLDSQIMEHRNLISQNQTKLKEAQAHLDDLNEKNKERLRSMEENGKLSYWSVVFKANSFIDLIDRMNIAQEIADSDKRMMESMEQAVNEVTRVQNELVTQKTELDKSHAQQLAAQENLEAKRAESDEILNRLNMERSSLASEQQEMEDAQNALLEEIAQAEVAYNEAHAREEEERRRQEEERRKQEEEERRKQEEANKPAPAPAPQSGNESQPEPTAPPETEPEEETSSPSSGDSGWLQPCSYIYISSPYGNRSSGWHNGVDFAGSYGIPIYATRSGTVTRVRSMTTSYGNHVVINHGDGFSSLYAHMDYYVVSEGQYVSQGELIGYMGSTGNSTGPHLHFTIMYNGDDVNPLGYV